jgi:hypothetical protein
MSNELKYIYVVTHYGCTSGHNDMWIPDSRAFLDEEDAYSYFHMISKRLKHFSSNNSQDNYDEKIRHTSIKDIENIVQDGDFFKRPEGVVIQRVLLQ